MERNVGCGLHAVNRSSWLRRRERAAPRLGPLPYATLENDGTQAQDDLHRHRNRQGAMAADWLSRIKPPIAQAKLRLRDDTARRQLATGALDRGRFESGLTHRQQISDAHAPWPRLRSALTAAATATSAPLRKFVIHTSILSHELRKQKGTSKSRILVPLFDLKFLMTLPHAV